MKNSAPQNRTRWFISAVQSATDAYSNNHQMEHRWGVRRTCRARVCVSAGTGIAGTGRLRDVSMSGAFLETALPLPLFSQIAVAVLLPDGAKHAVEFTATVVRIGAGGVGLEWCEIAPGSVCDLLGCTLNCSASGHH